MSFPACPPYHKAHFKIGTLIDYSDERDEARGGKVHVANALARLVQHFFKIEFNRFALSHQPPAVAGA